MKKLVLAPRAKAFLEKAPEVLLQELILVLSEHPGMAYYLLKHGIIEEIETESASEP